MYLHVVSCTVVSALSVQPTCSDGTDLLRYARFMQKLLQLSRELQFSDLIYIFSAIPPSHDFIDAELCIQEATRVFASFFKESSNVVFPKNEVVVFKHLLGWFLSDDNIYPIEDVVSFSLFKVWLENHKDLTMENLSCGLHELVQRLHKLSTDQLQAATLWIQDNVRKLVFSLLLPRIKQLLSANVTCLKSLSSMMHNMQLLFTWLINSMNVASGMFYTNL